MNTSLSASECHCQPFNDKTNINKLQMSRILVTLPSHAQIASKNAKQPRLSHVYQHKTWSWKWPASQYEAVHTLANTSSCHLYKSECCIWFHPAPRCWYIGTKNCSFKASAWVLEPPKERASFANRLSKSVFSKTPKTFLQIRPCVFFVKDRLFCWTESVWTSHVPNMEISAFRCACFSMKLWNVWIASHQTISDRQTLKSAEGSDATQQIWKNRNQNPLIRSKISDLNPAQLISQLPTSFLWSPVIFDHPNFFPEGDFTLGPFFVALAFLAWQKLDLTKAINKRWNMKKQKETFGRKLFTSFFLSLFLTNSEAEHFSLEDFC